MGAQGCRANVLLFASLLLSVQLARAVSTKRNNGSCQRTQVAILGAGTAGITAAQALTNASISDFVILEYLADIGGRVAHTTFGASADGTPYIVELGANWVQGLQTDDGPENPIWFLAQKYNLTNTYSDYSSVETFNETGAVDYASMIGDFNDNYYAAYEQNAGYTLTENLQDTSARSALSLVGWKPKKDPMSQAVEWWLFDWEYSFDPEQSSALFSVANYNSTFYQYSEENNYVFDPRGFNTFIKGEASTFLRNGTSDPRLKPNTIVTNITYSPSGVTIHNSDGTCLSADYAICTFSLGVLQNDVISFDPPLPTWKEKAISTFSMGTYTKIFLRWPIEQVFWNTSTQFFLYADPVQRGWYPVFQSLDAPGFLPGSGILFCTVVHDFSYKVEAQDDENTKQEVLAVLRSMFGPENVPAPTAFMYPRWSLEPWAFGSYSNWPPGTSLEAHQNLRANVDRLYFAGEATSTQHYGYLHGAYFEGAEAGRTVAECILSRAEADGCEGYQNYEMLHGTTEVGKYNATNGWMVSSFQTLGFYG